jgi:8-oxo-dGTP pyrophosphatase MutT (NUDIX family)
MSVLDFVDTIDRMVKDLISKGMLLETDDLISLREEMRMVPIRHRGLVWSRILDGAPTHVSGLYFFVQKWHFTNYWNWPDTEVEWESPAVACLDFPMAWLHSTVSRPLIVGWREKLDGVPYVKKDGKFVGDEILELPVECSFVEAFERVGNDFFVLSPYKCPKDWDSGKKIGNFYFFSHKWRQDSIATAGEGVMVLMTDNKEYRIKRIPTTEVERDGQVYEVKLEMERVVAMQYKPKLVLHAPRAGRKAKKTEEMAIQYLASQITLSMFDLRVEAEMSERKIELRDVMVRGKGDTVSLSVEGTAPTRIFVNEARVPTSAKVLIQDKKGNFLLHREGDKGWDLVGGKACFLDEPPSEILVREAQEEIGYTLPKMDWKHIRVSEVSIGFLYHIIVDPTVIKETPRTQWFSPKTFLDVLLKECVLWLPALLNDVMASGPVVSMLPVGTEYNVLTLARAGDKCYSTTRGGGKRDILGNALQEGCYLTPVVPTVWCDVSGVQWSKYPLDWIPLKDKYDPGTKTFRTKMDDFGVELMPYQTTRQMRSVVQMMHTFVRGQYLQSFEWQQYCSRFPSSTDPVTQLDQRRRFAYWNMATSQPRGFKQRVVWYYHELDTFGWYYLGEEDDRVPAHIRQYIVKHIGRSQEIFAVFSGLEYPSCRIVERTEAINRY